MLWRFGGSTRPSLQGPYTPGAVEESEDKQTQIRPLKLAVNAKKTKGAIGWKITHGRGAYVISSIGESFASIGMLTAFHTLKCEKSDDRSCLLLAAYPKGMLRLICSPVFLPLEIRFL